MCAIHAIPKFEATMLPILKFAEDKQEHSIRETTDHLSDF
jgi:restriction endonuclease Mrr